MKVRTQEVRQVLFAGMAALLAKASLRLRYVTSLIDTTLHALASRHFNYIP